MNIEYLIMALNEIFQSNWHTLKGTVHNFADSFVLCEELSLIKWRIHIIQGTILRMSGYHPKNGMYCIKSFDAILNFYSHTDTCNTIRKCMDETLDAVSLAQPRASNA